MSRYNPPPYSPHYDFIAMRPMTIGGADLQRGDKIPKSEFSEQRLRQMFDARMIAPAGFAEFPQPAYLNNGKGKADKLRAEIEREEGEGADAAKPAKPAAPQRAAPKKPVAASKPQVRGKKPQPKPAKRKRAA